MGVGLHDSGAGGALRPDDHAAVPLSLANRNRDQTLEKHPQGRCLAGKSPQSPRCGVAPWQITLRVDVGTPYATQIRGSLESIGSRTGGHVVARLGDAPSRDHPADHRVVVLEGRGLGGLSKDAGRTTTPEKITAASS